MTIFRSAIAGDTITSLQRSALQDKRLSFRALGVLCAVLSRPPNWQTNADRLSRERKEGRDAVRAALKELEACGYLVRRRDRGEHGRWEWGWHLTDDPGSIVVPGADEAVPPPVEDESAGQTMDGFPDDGNPSDGEPSDGEPSAGKPSISKEVQERGSRERSPVPAAPDPALMPPPEQPEVGPSFAEFYSAYPRHVDRKAAEAAWNRITRGRPGLARQIIAAAHAYAAAPKPDWQDYPYPSTWLNKDRWAEPLEAPQQHTGGSSTRDSLLDQARAAGGVVIRP